MTKLKHMDNKRVCPLIIFIFLLLIMDVNYAQWSQDPAVNTVVNDNYGSQYNPQIVTDMAGGAIIIWYDWHDDMNIYAQRLDKFGYRLWPEEGLPVCTMPGAQFEPKAISDGYGGAVLIWKDTRSDIGDIYAQRIDSTGALLWNGNEGLPICTNNDYQDYPRVVTDSLAFYFIWSDYRDESSGPYCQKVSLEGDILWQEDGVRVVNYDYEYGFIHRGYTPDGYGGLYITWQDFRNSIDEYHLEVWGQRIGSDGTHQWAPEGVPVAQFGRAIGAQAPIVRIDANSFICVFSNRLDEDGDNDIYAQRVDFDGNLLWDPNGVPICLAENEQKPWDLHWDGEDEVYILWDDQRDDGHDIYSQKINSDGVIQWGENGIAVCSQENSQTYFNSLLDNEGNFYVVWRDGRNIYTTGYNIYAQKISSDGENLWQINGIPISTALDFQMYPTMTKSQTSVIVSWSDWREPPSKNIYAQQISIFGELGDIPLPNGDLNQDNDTDILDIIILVEIILGSNIPTEYQQWAGDVNEDATIDILDILLTVNIILDG